MTQISQVSVLSDVFVSYTPRESSTEAMEALKAALVAAASEGPLFANISAKGARDAFEPATITVADDQLIATYKSGIQDVKFKTNFIEYRDNGQKVRLDYDDPAAQDLPEDPYNIDISFYGAGWSAELTDAFVAASEFLSDMIGAGLISDSTFSTTTGELLEIDDLVIEASLSLGDGVGNIVGGAEVEAVRSSDGSTPDGLPVLALMDFDVDDANALLELGIWDDLVLHEMIHALGFGTPLWYEDTLASDTFAGAAFIDLDPATPGAELYAIYAAPYYDSDLVSAVALADDLDPTPSVSSDLALARVDDPATFDIANPEGLFPVSLDPSETIGHWAEAAFGNALMTPVLSLEQNVLLDITLASLDDLGYDITLDLLNENNPLSDGIELVAENNVQFTDFAEDVLMLG